MIFCEECGGCLIRDTNNDTICEKCGVVYQSYSQELVRQSPRAFNSEDWKKRTHNEGAKGLGGMMNTTQHIHVHSPGQSSLSYREKSMIPILRDMSGLCTRLNLPESVKEESGRLLQKMVFKGRSIDTAMALVVFLIAKQQHVPRSLNLVLASAGLKNNTAVHKALKQIRRELNLPPVINHPQEYVSQIAADLDNLDEYVEVGAITIAKKFCDMFGLGKNPVVIAAACIHVAVAKSDEWLPRIAEAASVSETSIKKYSKELY